MQLAVCIRIKLKIRIKCQQNYRTVYYYNNIDGFRPCYSNPIFKRENFSLIQKLSLSSKAQLLTTLLTKSLAIHPCLYQHAFQG